MGLMSEKLSKVGIEPIIAVKERAYGQDIFCTKICGKIIESRFCIVILDDSVKDGNNIPNPNVYYEYGLMTALRKHIIPLQKDDLELAFNIQSYDTIKYNNKNITIEIDSAIRDAIRLTEIKEPGETIEPITYQFIYKRMEISGFERCYCHFTENTKFIQFLNTERDITVFLDIVDNDKEAKDFLDDLSVLIYRLKNKIEKSDKKSDKKSDEKSDEKCDKIVFPVYIGLITRFKTELDLFLKGANVIIEDKERYRIAYFFDDKIQFGEIIVDLARKA